MRRAATQPVLVDFVVVEAHLPVGTLQSAGLRPCGPTHAAAGTLSLRPKRSAAEGSAPWLTLVPVPRAGWIPRPAGSRLYLPRACATRPRAHAWRRERRETSATGTFRSLPRSASSWAWIAALAMAPPPCTVLTAAFQLLHTLSCRRRSCRLPRSSSLLRRVWKLVSPPPSATSTGREGMRAEDFEAVAEGALRLYILQVSACACTSPPW